MNRRLFIFLLLTATCLGTLGDLTFPTNGNQIIWPGGSMFLKDDLLSIEGSLFVTGVISTNVWSTSSSMKLSGSSENELLVEAQYTNVVQQAGAEKYIMRITGVFTAFHDIDYVIEFVDSETLKWKKDIGFGFGDYTEGPLLLAFPSPEDDAFDEGILIAFIQGPNFSVGDTYSFTALFSPDSILNVDTTIGLVTADALEVTNSLTVSSLTDGRVVLAGVDGILEDDADLTFLTDTLTATEMVVTNDLTVDTDTLFVDSTAHRVGIGTITPTSHLEIRDDSGVTTPTFTFYDTDNQLADGQVLGSVDWFKTDISTTGAQITAQLQAVSADSDGGSVDIILNMARLNNPWTVEEKFRFSRKGGFKMQPTTPSATQTAGLEVLATVWNSTKPIVNFSNTDAFPDDSASVLQLYARGNKADSYYLQCYSDVRGVVDFTVTQDGEVACSNGLTVDTDVLVVDSTNNTVTVDTDVFKVDADTDIVSVNGTTNLGDGGTTNYTAISATGLQTMAGSARVRKHVIIPVESASFGSSAPAAAFIGNFAVDQFSQNSPVQSIYMTWHIPTEWDVGTDIAIHIHWAPVNGNAGDVVWDIDYSIIASEANEVISGAGTNVTATDSTQSLQDELLESPDMTIAGAGISLEDSIGLKISRDTDDAGDTYGSSASLVFVEISYISDKLGEVL